MCLEITPNARTSECVWKIVAYIEQNHWYKPGYYSPFSHRHRWTPGRNVSSRTQVALSAIEAELQVVSCGFHTLTELGQAMALTLSGDGFTTYFGNAPMNRRLLRLRVRQDHLVAAGHWEERAGSAVYTEVENLGPYTGND